MFSFGVGNISRQWLLFLFEAYFCIFLNNKSEGKEGAAAEGQKKGMERRRTQHRGASAVKDNWQE